MPLVVIGLIFYVVSPAMSPATVSPGYQESGNDHASPPVWSHDGNASFIFDKQSTGTLLSRITYDSEQVLLLLPAH